VAAMAPAPVIPEQPEGIHELASHTMQNSGAHFSLGEEGGLFKSAVWYSPLDIRDSFGLSARNISFRLQTPLFDDAVRVPIYLKILGLFEKP
jgi:hypothetical protein